MSVLDGLRKSADLVPTGAGWYNAALDDVREALRSDEIRAAIAVVLENTLCSCRRRDESFFGGFCGECEADAVVAFLVGGRR